ncbi:MAG: DUF4230 domain-containing protein, partial [Bacteroidales bacterium]|nr:DUF4230 domain-containing protein [Bacteroidales bacterium]
MKKIGLFLLVFLVGLFVSWYFFTKKSAIDTIAHHNEIVEKIESIGRLELVRMSVQDVLEYEMVRQWLPNAKAVLIVYGEAVGCIDLQKIQAADIFVSGDSISIKLPDPELAYCKIDHQKSRVYDTRNNFMSSIQLIDEAYRAAEKQ